jgi:hypothetical protein
MTPELARHLELKLLRQFYNEILQYRRDNRLSNKQHHQLQGAIIKVETFDLLLHKLGLTQTPPISE